MPSTAGSEKWGDDGDPPRHSKTQNNAFPRQRLDNTGNKRLGKNWDQDLGGNRGPHGQGV